MLCHEVNMSVDYCMGGWGMGEGVRGVPVCVCSCVLLGGIYTDWLMQPLLACMCMLHHKLTVCMITLY